MNIYLPNATILEITPSDESYRYRRIMGEDSMTLKWDSTDFVEIPTGSYVVFQGRTYTLYSPENFKKHGERHFEYTLILETYQAIARRFRLKDDTGKVKFNFTGTPRDFLDLIVRNMNQRDGGWTAGSWIKAEPKLISFDANTVIDAIQMCADAFETEWSFDDKAVSFGRVEYNKDAPVRLSYGRGNGFKPGTGRENSSDSEAFEILNVQGGERNIDYSRYGNQVLLLPRSQTIGFDGEYFSDEDGFNPAASRSYITDDAGLTVRRSDKALASYAEGCFDGSKIYPSIAHQILRVETSTETQDGETVTLYDIVVDAIEALDYRACQIAGETPTVIFQSGMLTGREFNLATRTDGTLDIEKYAEGGIFLGWRLKLCNDEQDGFLMPGGQFVPIVGGTVKVFGVQLPDAYICDDGTRTGASWSMFREAVRYMFSNEDPKFNFTGELQGKWARDNWTAVGPKLTPGGYVDFSDNQFLPNGALIRIVGIRDMINDPYCPVLELSNGAVHGGFGSQIAALANQESRIDMARKDAISYTRRGWRDAKETQSMLEQALLQEFSGTISPIAVNTMQMLVGSEALQYGFIASLNNDTIVPHALDINSSGHLVCPAGVIKHYEFGITDVRPLRAVTEYMRWSVAAATLAFTDDAKPYYLYIKAQQLASAGAGSASFVVSETPIGLTDVPGYWHFLYATIGSVLDGERSIFTCNGFTEVGPGRITAYKFISPDGLQYLDFLSKAFRVGDNNAFIQFDSNSSVFRLRGTLVQSPSGAEFPTPCFRGAYAGTTTYYYGDEVTYNGESWLHIGPALTNGVAPGTDKNIWMNTAAKGTNGQFKSIVFKRAASRPETPGDGSYTSPVPAGWSDGVPPGDSILWMTTCVFVHGSTDAPAWTTPAQVTDTADIDFEFSAVEDSPGTPASDPDNWHDAATDSDVWMAVRKCENGVWGSWEVTKIKGEKGDPGVSVIAQYSANGTDWHGAFAATDIYMRTSSDGGTTWGGAIRIVGEEGQPGKDGTPGPYTDYTFAYSPNLMSSQPDGCPTDSGPDGSTGNRITTWHDAPPAVVAGWYLWVRVCDKTWDAKTESYQSGTASYFRINGTNGTDGSTGPMPRGLNQWRSGMEYYAGNPGEEYRDYVIYDGGKYKCIVTHTAGSTFDATKWTAANDMDFVAMRALYAEHLIALQALIDKLQIKKLFTDTTTGGSVEIDGGAMAVKDSSGNLRANIHGSAMTDSGAGSSITRTLTAKSGSCTSGEAQIELTILGSNSIAIANGNNKVTVPAFSLSVSKSASALNPYVGRVAVSLMFISLSTGKTVFSHEAPIFSQSGSIHVPASTVVLAPGSWGLSMYIGFTEAEGNNETFSATLTPLSSTLIVSIKSADAINEMAADGFRSVWNGEGLKVSGSGACVIQGGVEYPALSGSSGIKRIQIVTGSDYPSGEDGVLYLKVTPS